MNKIGYGRPLGGAFFLGMIIGAFTIGGWPGMLTIGLGFAAVMAVLVFLYNMSKAR